MIKAAFILFLMMQGLCGSAQEQLFKTSDGVDLYVTVKGTGTPCLYLHGGPGSGSHWAEKLSGDILEKHFKMIYLDQRGVGRSGSAANGDYSADRMVKDFEEIRKSLGISRWLTMGHSFGGILQMQYVLRCPDAIAGMLMFNCTLDLQESVSSALPKAYEFIDEPGLKMYLNDSIPIVERITKLYGRLREKDMFWKMGYDSRESEELMNSTFRGIPNWNGDYESKAIENPENWADYRPFAAGVKIPVLFFYGTSDWMVGPGHYKGVNFPVVMFWKSDTGHMPFIENKPDMEEAITEFLEKYSFE